MNTGVHRVSLLGAEAGQVETEPSSKDRSESSKNNNLGTQCRPVCYQTYDTVSNVKVLNINVQIGVVQRLERNSYFL